MTSLLLFEPPPAQHDPCSWCAGPIAVAARRDSVYCSKRCRQAAHRFRAGYAPRPPATDRPLQLAYADPPYPGKATIYRDHPDFAGEVDHLELISNLVAGYPDGWALSTSAAALPRVLRLCPDDVRVASWHRGERPTRAGIPLNGWEPVIWRGGREIMRDPHERVVDTLDYVARARTTEPRRVTGAKPAAFAWWLFDLLGARGGDQLDDLYAGSGGIARAWRIFQEGPPDASWRPRRGRVAGVLR